MIKANEELIKGMIDYKHTIFHLKLFSNLK